MGRPAMAPPNPFVRGNGVQRRMASNVASVSAWRARVSPPTVAKVTRGAPITVPSRLKLKGTVISMRSSRVRPAGGVQQAPIAGKMSRIVSIGPAGAGRFV
jgi:hypothetical protein